MMLCQTLSLPNRSGFYIKFLYWNQRRCQDVFASGSVGGARARRRAGPLLTCVRPKRSIHQKRPGELRDAGKSASACADDRDRPGAGACRSRGVRAGEPLGSHGWRRCGPFAEHQPDDGRLWLSTEVCEPPGERLALYELILQYNARWKETGGVRLALDGPEGSVVLAYDMPLAGLDLPRLQTVIRNFRDTLDGWRKIVAASGQTAGRGTGGLDPMPPGALRG